MTKAQYEIQLLQGIIDQLKAIDAQYKTMIDSSNKCLDSERRYIESIAKI